MGSLSLSLVLLGSPSINQGDKKEVSPMVKVALIETLGSEVWVLGKCRENRIDHEWNRDRWTTQGGQSVFTLFMFERRSELWKSGIPKV